MGVCVCMGFAIVREDPLVDRIPLQPVALHKTQLRRLAKWALFLLRHDYEIYHIPGHASGVTRLGESNAIADYLTAAGASSETGSDRPVAPPPNLLTYVRACRYG